MFPITLQTSSIVPILIHASDTILWDYIGEMDYILAVSKYFISVLL